MNSRSLTRYRISSGTILTTIPLFLRGRPPPDDIEDWDSLEQINLLTAMEKQFGVKFKLDDVRGRANVGDMVDLIIRLRG